jgi:hypothetical protein
VVSGDYDFLFRWLASYPKSGNTWVRLFMQAYRHGDLNFNSLGNLSDTSRICWQGATFQPLSKLTEQHAALVRPAALFNLQLQCATIPIERPVVKTHAANVCVLDVTQIPAQLTYSAVHLVRDPRDVAVSWASHFGQDQDTAIERLCDNGNALASNDTLSVLCDWSRHTETWQQASNVLTVQYEDLKTKPYVEFAKIVRHIGDEWDQERFDRALEMTDFDHLKQREEKDGFAEAREGRFFRKGQTGGYAEALTADQIKRIEDAHGPKMREFGYL